MAWDLWLAINTVILAMVDNPFFLLFLLIFLIMIPLSLFGILKVFDWANTFMKVRSGWIKFRKKISNGRWVEHWVKPTGRKVKMKGEEGYVFELPIKIEKDYMGFQKQLKTNEVMYVKGRELQDLREQVVKDKINVPDDCILYEEVKRV